MEMYKDILKGLASTLGVTMLQHDMIWWVIVKQLCERNRLKHKMLEKSLNKFKKEFQATTDELQGKHVVPLDGNTLGS